MPKFIAKTNLTLGTGPREAHVQVKKGDVFEVSESYADEHLHEAHVDEAEDDAPVTTEVKAVERRTKKAAKKTARKAKSTKEETKSE